MLLKESMLFTIVVKNKTKHSENNQNLNTLMIVAIDLLLL